VKRRSWPASPDFPDGVWDIENGENGTRFGNVLIDALEFGGDRGQQTCLGNLFTLIGKGEVKAAQLLRVASRKAIAKFCGEAFSQLFE
jgi:hypothetical protein